MTDGRRRWRRAAIVVLVLLVVVGVGVRIALDRMGGAWTGDPEDLPGLSPAAAALVRAALADLDPDRLVDHHVHVVGTGTGGAETWVNPRMESWLHPVDRTRFLLYRDAAGVTDPDRADEQFAARLIDLVDHFPGKGRFGLLAFDWKYDRDGGIDRDGSEFRVGDARVFDLAARRPDRFFPVISAHPYRADFEEALEAGASRGARVVKWLPNAMGIDPADPALDPAYAKMAELGLVLLTHGGEEQAVHAAEDQALGNPLRLRRALDAGVTVIVAHCASLGTGEDLDDPARPRVPNLALFLRLMEEDRHRGRLYGDLSAVTQGNRFDSALGILLEREDLHDRLVNGSDYPLPAVNVVIRTSALVAKGYLTEEERTALNEIYDVNPLLFDFVLKRTVHHPRTGKRFPPEVFLARPGIVP